jgi:hypothetical protein
MNDTVTETLAELMKSREELLKKQKLIDMMVGERQRVMNALIDLTNATHGFRELWIWLPNSSDITAAWNAAYYLCSRWNAVMQTHPTAPLPTAQDLPPAVNPHGGSEK